MMKFIFHTRIAGDSAGQLTQTSDGTHFLIQQGVDAHSHTLITTTTRGSPQTVKEILNKKQINCHWKINQNISFISFYLKWNGWMLFLQEENGFSSAYLLVTRSQFGHIPSSAELSAVGGVDSDSHYYSLAHASTEFRPPS